MGSSPTLAGLELSISKVKAETHSLEALVYAMQHVSDENASTLLAKLRLGISVEELVAPLERLPQGRSCR